MTIPADPVSRAWANDPVVDIVEGERGAGYEAWRRERMNPDCRGGKHAVCAGDAWDTETDSRIGCLCSCHSKVAT